MHRYQRLSTAFKSGGFSLHYRIGRWLHIGFSTQCFVVSGVAALILLLGSIADNSLILPGADIGFFEHPGIWGFLIVQSAIPICLRASLARLLRARHNLREVGALRATEFLGCMVNPLAQFLTVCDATSKIIATAIYLFGLSAFVWNTYQNQLPGIALPNDFWDSKTFAWGFWLTRIYKAYIFIWLFPYCAFLHIALLIVPLKILRRARKERRLRVLPFHPDDLGGLGFMPDLITRPLVIAVLLSAIPTTAAIYIHKKADVTPLMGSSVLILATAVAYLLPIISLRSDLIAAKAGVVEMLRRKQQTSFASAFAGENFELRKLQSATASIELCEKLCASVRRISNYPHFKRLLGVITLAMTPTIASWIGKAWTGLVPFIRPILMPT